MAQPSLSDLEPVFQAAGTEWNVDPLLLRAMAGQESSGRPNVTSTAGAQGLMQIMPQTQKDLGITDPMDPVQSIWGAAKYMDQALAAENGSVEQALLYYHGGPNWRDPKNFGTESKNYVPGIAARYQALLKQQQQNAPPMAPAPTAPPDGQQTAAR